MKIAYLFLGSANTHTGVYQKILRQKNLWEKQGTDVKLFNLDMSPKQKNSAIAKYSFYEKKLREIISDIDKFQPTVVYARYLRYTPALNKLLRKYPVVFEINSDDVKESWLAGRSKGLFNVMTRHKTLGNASGLVFVTNELQKNKRFSKFNKESIVVSNGIEKLKKPKHPGKYKTPTCVFIGSPQQPWHGVEKILYLAQKLPKTHFRFIGFTKEKIPNNFRKFNNNNIFFHGYLDQRESNKIISKAHVGIGTLSLHVKEMEEACSLKVRQYVANGLPTILGYKDTDLSNTNSPYILQLDNTPDNVKKGLEKIKKFIAKSVRYKPEDVKKELFPKVAAEKKEAERLEFFKKVAEKYSQKY